MTGVNHCPPADPIFVIEQEAPFISPGESLPSRAFVANSFISAEIQTWICDLHLLRPVQVVHGLYQQQFQYCNNAYK